MKRLTAYFPQRRTPLRRGMSVVQTAVMLVLIAVAVFVAARSLSTNAASDLQNTAGEVGDPSTLVHRFE